MIHHFFEPLLSGNYILLDAARMNQAMEISKDLNPNFNSLYKEKDDPIIQSVAPFLFIFPHSKEFKDYYFDKGWGNSWGVMIYATAGFDELSRHFRRFVIVKSEDGVEFYFRFYDPRVLRVFLPDCDAKQLKAFFGPIHYFLLEDENPDYMIKFWMENNQLKTEKLLINAKEDPMQPKIQSSAAEIKPEELQNKAVRQTKISESAKPSKPKWNMFE